MTASKETTAGRRAGAQQKVVKALLPALLACGPSSPEDLLKHVPLKDSRAVMRNANALADEGWVRVAETARRQGYRRVFDRVVSLGDEAGWTVAVTVMREGLHCALVDPHGVIRYPMGSRPALFPPGQPGVGPEDLREILATCIGRSIRRYAKADGGRPLRLVGCMVAWPSRVGSDGEPVPFAPRQAWADTKVSTLIGQGLGQALRTADQSGQEIRVPPVKIVNDADAEALAEVRTGAAIDAKALLMVKVGGGVGGSVVLDGRVHHGAHGFAGELGHVPVDVEVAERVLTTKGAPALDRAAGCSCGSEAHLQSYASVEAIMSRIQGRRILLRGEDETRAFLEATRALQHNQARVSSVLRQTGELIGYVLRAPVMALDPDVVMIRPGIGPAPARKQLLEGVRASLSQALPALDYDLRLGTHGDSGASIMSLVGASLHAVDSFVAPRIRARAEGQRTRPASVVVTTV